MLVRFSQVGWFSYLSVIIFSIQIKASTIECPHSTECKCTPPNIKIKCIYHNSTTFPIVNIKFKTLVFDNYPSLPSFAFRNILYENNARIKLTNISSIETDAFNGDVFNSLEISYFSVMEIKPFAFRNLTCDRLEIYSRSENINFNASSFDYLDAGVLIIDYDRNKNSSSGIIGQFEKSPRIRAFIMQEATGISEINATTIPKFSETEYIRIEYSNASVVRTCSFEHFMHLDKLDLSNNNIQIIESYAFAGLNKLNTLLLSGNSIKSVTENSFYGLTKLEFIEYNLENKIMHYDDYLCLMAAFPRHAMIEIGEKAACTCAVFYLHILHGAGKYLPYAPECYRQLSPIEMDNMIASCYLLEKNYSCLYSSDVNRSHILSNCRKTNIDLSECNDIINCMKVNNFKTTMMPFDYSNTTVMDDEASFMNINDDTFFTTNLLTINITDAQTTFEPINASETLNDSVSFYDIFDSENEDTLQKIDSINISYPEINDIQSDNDSTPTIKHLLQLMHIKNPVALENVLRETRLFKRHAKSRYFVIMNVTTFLLFVSVLANIVLTIMLLRRNFYL